MKIRAAKETDIVEVHLWDTTVPEHFVLYSVPF
jgi:hypothetical protein